MATCRNDDSAKGVVGGINGRGLVVDGGAPARSIAVEQDKDGRDRSVDLDTQGGGTAFAELDLWDWAGRCGGWTPAHGHFFQDDAVGNIKVRVECAHQRLVWSLHNLGIINQIGARQSGM